MTLLRVVMVGFNGEHIYPLCVYAKFRTCLVEQIQQYILWLRTYCKLTYRVNEHTWQMQHRVWNNIIMTSVSYPAGEGQTVAEVGVQKWVYPERFWEIRGCSEKILRNIGIGYTRLLEILRTMGCPRWYWEIRGCTTMYKDVWKCKVRTLLIL